jgi:glucosamine 6-phosphate synthetase-like amidotransferase/phosphosugar isomerase protein
VSPIEAMQVIMKKLKGRFVLMVLVEEGNWLMVGCRDYPLTVFKADQTVYFGTDVETLALESKSIIPVAGKLKPTIFCATSSRSDLILPVPL